MERVIFILLTALVQQYSHERGDQHQTYQVLPSNENFLLMSQLTIHNMSLSLQGNIIMITAERGVMSVLYDCLMLRGQPNLATRFGRCHAGQANFLLSAPYLAKVERKMQRDLTNKLQCCERLALGCSGVVCPRAQATSPVCLQSGLLAHGLEWSGARGQTTAQM